MQSPIVMSFRKRLKKRGYTDISIKGVTVHNKYEYIVSAIEPLAKTRVSREYSLIAMDNSFK